MSAYMVSDATLIAIAMESARRYQGTIDARRAVDAYRTLHAGNVASLRARYPRGWESMITPCANLTSLHIDRAVIAHDRLAPASIIKACREYDYQACEVATSERPYEATEAFAVSNHAMVRAIDRLPGYEDAPRIGR